MTTEFIVGTADLRQALEAIKPHVGKPTGSPELARVRFIVGRENVVLIATDRFTAGLAIVSIWEPGPRDGERSEVAEILISDVAKILTIHNVAGRESSDQPDYRLRIVISDEHFVVTDVSGLIEGRSLRVPRLATEDALSAVPMLIEHAHGGQLALLEDITDLTVNGDHLARFKAAASAYNSSITMETRRYEHRKHERLSVLVRCGGSFLGLMVPRPVLDEARVEAKQHAEDWNERLPGIVQSAPEAEADLLGRAVKLVVTMRNSMPSMLQRRLIIGYARAQGLLEKMAEHGILGADPGGNKDRPILVRPNELDAALERIKGETAEAAAGSEA